MRLRLTLVVVLAVVLRVAAAQVIGDSHVPWSYEYEEIAHNLITRGEYAYNFYNLTAPLPTSFLPPVYPLFLAFGRTWLGGDTAVKALQIGFSGLSVLGLYALAQELGASARQAALAALLMAIYPPAVAYAGDINTVTLEIAFVTGGVWLVLRATKRGSSLSAAGAGVLLSLAALTRSTWLALLPLAVAWLAWYYRGRDWSFISRQVAPLLLAAAVVFTPWVWHNHVIQGEWLLTSTNGGLNFWIGNNAKSTGEFVFPTSIDKDTVLSVANWPESARDRFFYSRGLEFIRSSPAQSLELFGRKLLFYLFFRPNIGSNYQQTQLQIGLAAWFFVLSWLALLPFALVGVLNLGRQWRKHVWLMIIFVGQVAISVLYFVGTRFRTPMDGFAMIWAVMGLSILVSKWKTARSRKRRC